MNLKLESQDGFLVATIGGNLSFGEALKIGKSVCDAAAEKGYRDILADCLALKGKLSVADMYELGKTMAEHCLKKSLAVRVAMIGQAPTITGFGAQVARNRGLSVRTFTDRQAGLDWLNQFRPKPPQRETSGGVNVRVQFRPKLTRDES
jgi:hypothetical protein